MISPRRDTRDIPSAPVRRGLLFRSALVELRDNACNRHDPALSRETAPMPYHEIVFGRSGLWSRHEGRRELPVDAQHVHFFTRGTSHRVAHPAGCGDRNTGLVIEPETLAALATDAGLTATAEQPFPVTHRRQQPRLLAAHRILLASARGAPTRGTEPLAVEELALQLVAHVFAGAGTPATSRAATPTERARVAEARALLHHELSEPLSLSELAAAVGCSPFHLARTFRRVVGMPLMRYRAGLRLAAALGEVIDTERPLAEIAASTGFADRSHLTRALHAALGDPPRVVRDALRAGRARVLAERLLARSDDATACAEQDRTRAV